MTQPSPGVRHWFFGWASTPTDHWGVLPAVPVLYFFMLTGTLHIIATPGGTISGVPHIPAWGALIWRVSGLVAPLLATLAWYLVNKRSGKPRLFGMWLRFAGDFSQMISLLVFVVMRTAYSPVTDDAHIYLMHLAYGVLAFVLMLVARDVWILLKVQEIAGYIERLSDAGVDLEEL